MSLPLPLPPPAAIKLKQLLMLGGMVLAAMGIAIVFF